jgi:hypothetical protein
MLKKHCKKDLIRTKKYITIATFMPRINQVIIHNNFQNLKITHLPFKDIRSVVLKLGVATHLCVAKNSKIFQTTNQKTIYCSFYNKSFCCRRFADC